MGLRCNCLVGALAIRTMRDTIITLVQSQYSLPRTKYRTRSPVVATAKIDNNEKTRMIRCLVHSVIGVLYRAAANRRQRNLHIIKGRCDWLRRLRSGVFPKSVSLTRFRLQTCADSISTCFCFENAVSASAPTETKRFRQKQT